MLSIVVRKKTLFFEKKKCGGYVIQRTVFLFLFYFDIDGVAETSYYASTVEVHNSVHFVFLCSTTSIESTSFKRKIVAFDGKENNCSHFPQMKLSNLVQQNAAYSLISMTLFCCLFCFFIPLPFSPLFRMGD